MRVEPRFVAVASQITEELPGVWTKPSELTRDGLLLFSLGIPGVVPVH